MWHFAESTTKKENCGSRIVTLTKRLVRANITSVMNDERRKQTEQKLIRSGRAEFLEKGYAKANLRDICKAARVTTGAFYFSFENKEFDYEKFGRAAADAMITAGIGFKCDEREFARLIKDLIDYV